VVKIAEIHLVQLFQNLIGNALKYRKEGSTDEKPHVKVAAQLQSDGTYLFSVADNGIGIEEEYLTQIFGIFKRLHGQAFEGTGIGLALCQKIVERAGGHIWAESEQGKGSTFYFTVPEVGTAEVGTGEVDTGNDERAIYNTASRG
jgi:signal transduction histidine kinase